MSYTQTSRALAGLVQLQAKVKSLSIPIVAQACLSIANFLVGILLVRHAPAQEYGLYVLGFSIMLIMLGVQESLVTVPVTVRASAFAAQAKARFLRWNRRSLHGIFLLIGLLALALAPLFTADRVGTDYRLVVATIGLAGWAYNAWDFQRAEVFAKGTTHLLLRTDGTYLVALTIAMLSIWALGKIEAVYVLAAMGVCALLAAYVSTGFGKALEFRPTRLKRAFGYWWQRGRWSFAASQLTWVQGQAYIYIVSALLGLEALAAVAAARLLFAPIATMVAAWARTSLPQIAYRAAQRDSTGLFSMLRKASFALLALTAVWALLIFALQDLVLTHVFRGKYQDIHLLIALWGFAFGASTFEAVWLTGLRASAAFQKVTQIGVVGCLATLAGSLIGVKLMGAAGAVLACAISELMMALMAMLILRARRVKGA